MLSPRNVLDILEKEIAFEQAAFKQAQDAVRRTVEPSGPGTFGKFTDSRELLALEREVQHRHGRLAALADLRTILVTEGL